MKLALITDIHAGVKNDSVYFRDKQIEFFTNTFIPYLIEHNIDNVLMLGDFWDRRKYISFDTLHLFKEKLFNKLEELNIKVTMIYGNHDVYYRNTNEVNSIDMLASQYNNIHVVKTHEIVDFDGLPIAFISWINAGNIESSLDFIKTAASPILCGHFEIKEFEMVKGQVCVSGFDKKMFERFEYVFSGHFHVVSTDGQIKYIGNPFQTNWGDCGLDKGFSVFDTATRDLTYVKNPVNIYEKLVFDDGIDILKFDYESFKDKIVRIYVKSFELKSRKKFDLFVDKLSTFVHGMDVHELETGSVNEFETNPEKAETTSSIIDKYIDNIELEGIDKAVLRNYFQQILNEAKENSSNDYI